jgi:hypothetical protein
VGRVSVNERADRRALRVFVASPADNVDADWIELTTGEQPAVRVSALDLQQAQRARARIRNDADVAVVLDITVLVAEDYRSAYRGMTAVQSDSPASVRYAGTLDGLVGLVADIFVAGVADGVTLIPATPQQDVEVLAAAVLARIGDRLTVAA